VTNSLVKLRKALMGVSEKTATAFSAGNSEEWKHLEQAVLSAIEGYHATLVSNKFAVLVPLLDKIELDMRGFAYEGAAMGLTAMDCVLPWKNRLQAYLDGPGSPHVYMVHIGAGEALARLRRKPEPFIARMKDRVLCWLVMDGYGFHEGFFYTQRTIERQIVPSHLSIYARRIFDQGVGRSIWFSTGTNVERIASTIGAFPEHRRADMWAGIGVACTYVGGVDSEIIEDLRMAAGQYGPQLALGASVVAKGRQRAGNPVPHTDLACEILCGISSRQAAQLVDFAFLSLPVDGPEPAFEILQQRLLAQFAGRTVDVYRRKEIMQ
jgi:hypothetical protein